MCITTINIDKSITYATKNPEDNALLLLSFGYEQLLKIDA
jgi:hypothetical protein